MKMFLKIIIFFLINIIFINGDNDDTTQPDLTLLINNNKTYFNFVCVAGISEKGKGLSFITPFKNEFSSILSVSKYKNENGTDFTSNNYDCDFESINNCDKNWIKDETNISSNFLLVTDERWEKFSTILLNDKNFFFYNLKENQNTFSFSLRARMEIFILLCDDKNQMTCDWITIQNKNIKRNRYTHLNINELSKQHPVLDQDQTGKILKVNNKNWIHLSLKNLNSKNKLKIGLYSNDENLIEFQQEESFKISKIVFATSSGSSFCKIHNYSFLELDFNKKQSYNIGPIIKSVNLDRICLSFYVIVCEFCELLITLNHNDLIKIKGQRSQNWQQVNLISKVQEGFSYNLLVEGIKNGNGKGFWGIDDVRQCNINETRLIEMNIPTDYIKNETNISCQNILNQTYSAINQGGKVQTTENNICSNVSNLGENCNITCKSVTGKVFCQKYIICKITKNKNEKCACSAGYWGENCNKECVPGFFGYDCKKKCPACTDNPCDRLTGSCYGESCTEKNINCNIPELPIIKYAPLLVSSNLEKITVRLNNSDYIGKLSPTHYKIQYKAKDDKTWKSTEEFYLINNLRNITINKLSPLTFYTFRVMLYVEDKFSNDIEIPQTIFQTVCKDVDENDMKNLIKDITLNFNSNILNITWTPICQGNLIIRLIEHFMNNANEFDNKQENSINKECYFDQLTPLTSYSVFIRNSENENIFYNNTFSTKPGNYPRLITGPKLINTTLSSISIVFNKINIQGTKNAETFQIQIKLKESNSWENWNTRKSIEENNYVSITGLKSNTFYEVRVIFYTSNLSFDANKIPYLTAITNCTQLTRNLLLKPIENIKTNTEKNNLIVEWIPVCDKNLVIKINCEKVNEEKWCKKPYENENKIRVADKQYKWSNLSPFSTYSLSINDDNNNKIYQGQIKTPEGEPSAVRNLQVYSRDDSSIAIRWMEPYPPNGIIDAYQQYHTPGCQNNFFPTYYSTIPLSKCDIWTDYFCYKITQISNKNDCYSLMVRGYNSNLNKPGAQTIIKIEGNKESDPPINPVVIINETTNKNPKICWTHPNFTKGDVVDFELKIEQTETALIINKFETITKFINIKSQKLNYCYQIKNSLPLSSKYNIALSTKTILDNSKFIEKLFKSKPIKPKLLGSISLGFRTNKTQEILIPKIDDNTLTKNSVLYILLCCPNEKLNSTNLKINENKLRKWTNCTGDSWIVAQFDFPKEEKKFIIGDNSAIINKPLQSEMYYQINVILINEFNGVEEFEIYSTIAGQVQPEEMTSNWALLSLLLLIIPLTAIAYFGYRLYFNKRKNHSETEEYMLTDYLSSRKPVSTSTVISSPLLNNSNSSIFNVEYSREIEVSNLSQYVKESLTNGELERQHKMFEKGATQSWNYGMMIENKFKNRYNNITAYDHSRVVLEKMEGDPFSDFINANYIDGYNKKKAYIATQGPKANTLNDFWRMIWQEKVEYIIMLANLTEGGKKKCEQYWPDPKEPEKEFINMSVKFINSNIYADFEYRYFEVTFQNETRQVQQLHFTSWPDHGVPLYAQSLTPFLKRILAVSLLNAPIVVHCSAGVGRTGTIILIDICLRMAASEGCVDPLKYLSILRSQRVNLVDNFEQYKLVHMALLDCLLAPVTEIQCDKDLAKNIETLITSEELEKQMEYLKETEWHNQNLQSKSKISSKNAAKNRIQTIVPENSRIFITRYPFNDEDSDYINAIPVDGFKIKDQFIVTQNPLPNTINDFWRMIFEYEVKVIVSLNEFKNNEKSHTIFWPSENEEIIAMEHLTVTLQSVEVGTLFDIYQIQLKNNNAQEGSELTYTQIVQFKNWFPKKLTPNNEIDFLSLLEETQRLSREGNPTVVTCYDGLTASGLFVALSFIVEKIKLYQSCDVCLAIKVIRTNRKQFIKDKKQIQFLYNAALEYVNSFELYSNFNLT